MFKIMSKLINKKFYGTAEEAQQKCDVFYAVGRLTDDEYTDLCELIITVYGDATTGETTVA